MFIDSEKRLKQLSDKAKKTPRTSKKQRKIQGLHRYPQKVGNVFESC
ncbi:hypothetical protein V411_25285 [Escherichia coli LAU-EC6]|nr:hypothetical protein V411_25285 [Escherichia coli LAU-EC6]